MRIYMRKMRTTKNDQTEGDGVPVFADVKRAPSREPMRPSLITRTLERSRVIFRNVGKLYQAGSRLYQVKNKGNWPKQSNELVS